MEKWIVAAGGFGCFHVVTAGRDDPKGTFFSFKTSGQLQARDFSGFCNNVSGLAANQASLRRSLETENRSLSTGEETLGLVEKRFEADMSRIKELLQAAEEKTAKLSKSLEK